MEVPPSFIHQKVSHSRCHLNLHKMPEALAQAAFHAKGIEASSTRHQHRHFKTGYQIYEEKAPQQAGMPEAVSCMSANNISDTLSACAMQ